MKIWKFNKLSNAIGWKNHSVKMAMIILGDDNKFWVVTPAIAEQLINSGYELAI